MEAAGGAFSLGQTSGLSQCCNCKRSRCIKLYCECYASGNFCNGCKCVSCLNLKIHEDSRNKAIKSVLEKNPSAFQPKISEKMSEGGTENSDNQYIHYKGCSCKRSGCLKRYCECYQAGVPCSLNCKCKNCMNKEGSIRRDDDDYNHDRSNEISSYAFPAPKIPKFLYRILLPTEDLSSTFESELKKSRIIKSSIMKDSLELLNKQYLEDLETLLDDNGISEILKSHFSTKRLKVDSADKKVIHRNPSTDEFNKNDILACDEDFLGDVILGENKETPLKEQIDEYKIKQLLILHKFVDILNSVEKNIGKRSHDQNPSQ